MSKRILWLVVSGLMALSLVMAACAPAAPITPTTPTTPTTPAAPTAPAAPTTPTTEKPQQEAVKPSGEVPQYGGTLNVGRSGDLTSFDPTANTGQTAGGEHHDLVYDPLWHGDWARGVAGGYGTNEIQYTENTDFWELKAGMVAESTKWTVDSGKKEGTIVYQIRQGIHWALNPKSEASRLVGGRELTTDDVVAHLKRMVTDPNDSYVFRAQPEIRVAQIDKTGPWEVTVKLPVDALATAITRFGQGKIAPPEVIKKYGNQRDWRVSAGSGPFMLTDYVAGSQIIYTKNPNYWMTDPVGPGKGNQLPYLDSVRSLIIPDASTRQAAFRTGKIDIIDLGFEDAGRMRQQVPALKEVAAGASSAPSTPIRIDKAPFTDVRVRRAMFMAIDFNAILKNLYPGKGQQIITWPYEYNPAYADLYLGLDDPEMPASVKELYTYNPDKAKQLLKEAGYPNGFKTSVLITSTDADYYSILKDMWAKVGIELALDVKESGTRSNMVLNRQQEAMTTGTRNPIAIWYAATHFSDAAMQNASQVNDPYINETIAKIRLTLLTEGTKPAMLMWKEMTKYVLDQAYHIPGVRSSATRFWWPWLINYSGETDMGYYVWNAPKFLWIDQELKKQMGY
ncbi:MAG: ABC transporter substrate-binding protein [Chloroflexi bacterium]|nr:ABC transporter substrate-binding protein [Chloroflexota bacterium]